MLNIAVAWPEEAAGLGALAGASAPLLAFTWAILFGLVSLGWLSWMQNKEDMDAGEPGQRRLSPKRGAYLCSQHGHPRRGHRRQTSTGT